MSRGRRFSVPKSGNADTENEDACEIDVERGLAAVADGATDSSFSRAWARLLVDSFRLWPIDPASEPEDVAAWLDRPRAMWQRMIKGRELPWHAEHKVARGAFAAFVAATLRVDADSVAWSAFAVGDCCLFVVEGDRLTVAFPIDDPSLFGSSPFLLGTNPSANRDLASHLRRRHGRTARGALFLLMSDALAHWFLASALAGERPWQIVRRLDGQAAFAELIGRLRSDKLLRNDDSSLVMWEV